jgi:alcohol dehydrogenase
VETAVTRKRTPLSLAFSREALRLALAGLPRVLAAPDDLEARGWMLLGAAFAGTAIENSMVGAAHSAANPLTAHFGIVHGHAVGLMLPHVVRFNARDPAAAPTYAGMACAAGVASASEPPGAAAASLAGLLEGILERAGLPRSLKGLGVDAAQVPALALEAARQWTAQFNPRPVTPADFESLYAAAL